MRDTKATIALEPRFAITTPMERTAIADTAAIYPSRKTAPRTEVMSGPAAIAGVVIPRSIKSFMNI
jgi:hypothetical protein